MNWIRWLYCLYYDHDWRYVEPLIDEGEGVSGEIFTPMSECKRCGALKW